MATIDDLLANADRIMTFGLQSGRITDTRLLGAIEAAAKAKAAGVLTAGSPEAMALAAAVQDAIKSISPVTLADLNRGWNSFPAGGGSGRPPAPSGRRSSPPCCWCSRPATTRSGTSAPPT